MTIYKTLWVRKVLEITSKGLFLLFIGCNTTQIAHKSTRKEIKKAMSYSDWRYVLPIPKTQFKKK